MSTTLEKRKRSPLQPTGRWIRAARRVAIYIRDNFTCVYCERDLSLMSPLNITLDHVKPRGAGGSNDATNLVTACRKCNSGKGAKTLREFLNPEGRVVLQFLVDEVNLRVKRQTRKRLNMELARWVVNGALLPSELHEKGGDV